LTMARTEAEQRSTGVSEGAEPAVEPLRPRPLARRIAGGVRARILASYVILLAIAAFASVLAVRQVLLVRLDDRVEEDLQQEVEEFRELAGGINPRTGRPFGDDVNAIFRTYLDRNVPDDDEELITVPRRGTPRRDAGDNTQSYSFGDFVQRWRTLDEVERGEIDTPGGPARYVAIPVEGERGTLGTFAVAIFTADEREQVDEAVQIVAAVAAGVLLLGTILAFSISGRVLAPLRELRDAARSVSGTHMDRRIQVEGDDEIAELAGAFNRMLDRLAVAFSSQREFIRDVSHELRTPIAVSRGHLELLAEGHITDEAARREAIALVTGELDRTSRFVDDLLLLAKAESPDFLQLETVPLAELADELVAKSSATADRRWQIDSASPRSIVADRQRITQAVMNLAQNAVAHTGIGDEIGIGAAVDGSQAVIWVRDTGVGIPASEQRRIFSRFSRGVHSRGRYEGTGIGLAIVRAIAEAHGGRVRVTSRPGEGARFEILLPIEQEAPEEDWIVEVGE
jgi:two-component system, OmpR family, sensor kinase